MTAAAATPVGERHARAPLTPDQQKLASDHLAYAYELVAPYRASHPSSEDLFLSAAHLGLIRAARRYNPGRGSFATFSRRFIVGACLDVRRAHHPIRSRPGRPAPRIRVDTVDPATMPMYTLGFHRRPTVPDLDQVDEAEAIEPYARLLPDRHADLVRALFVMGYTQEECAERFGVTQSRVSAILAEAADILNGRAV